MSEHDEMPGPAKEGREVPPQRGDEGELFREYHERLMRTVAASTRLPRATIEDACSYTWGQLIRYQPDRDSIFAWLRTVAVREAVRATRQGAARASLTEEGDVEAVAVEPTRAGDPESGAEAREALTAVADLPRRQREILALHLAGPSYEEIGARTGDTGRTVDRQLCRARAALHARRGEGGET